VDTKKYAVFEKTVELGSLTKAAAELGLTQSGVSHIIAAIEEELGLTLLKRTRVGARLTDEGERLMPYIKDIVHADNELHKAAAKLGSATSGTVSIGTFTSVATHWLPAMMMQFQQKYAQVHFKLLNGDYHDVNQWFSEGQVELAFIALPTEIKCEYMPLYEDELVAILPKGHRLCQQEVCRVEEVAREPFISLLESSDHDVRRALDAGKIKPNVRFTTKDDYALIAMVRQGLGVSIMPSLLMRENSKDIEIRPLDPPSSRTIALAYPEAGLSAAAKQFADFAAAWVRENT